jgi:hypothetical protein
MANPHKPGSHVRLTRSVAHRGAADGTYEVLRQLPDIDGEHQYRVKSTREGHERVVRESELERA